MFSVDDLKEVAKKEGLNAAENIVRDGVIPFLEAKVQDSENSFDDMAFAAVKPLLLEFVDKIDGEEG
jgi:hypothetical protein